jgi:hypothetical protein
MSKKPPGKELASTMTTREFQTALQAFWTQRCRELLHERGNLPEDELGYVVEQVAKLKDERLKACIAELIGWGDDERAELETFCAIALEVMGMCSPSKLREATLRVELRYFMKDKD